MLKVDDYICFSSRFLIPEVLYLFLNLDPRNYLLLRLTNSLKMKLQLPNLVSIHILVSVEPEHHPLWFPSHVTVLVL